MNENVPNGLSQIHTKQSTVLSKQFNGLGSGNSSRDPSPSARYQQIPSSQLPPSRTGIPSSQLPPTRAQSTGVNHLTQNYAHLNISGLNTTNLTPFSSPKIQSFSTSTPVTENKEKESLINNEDTSASVSDIKKNVLSSINHDSLTTDIKQSMENREQTGAHIFTHSATSQFTNVIHNTLSNSNNLLPHESRSVLTSKSDQGVQRAFDPSLFTTTSVGPTSSNVKSLEQLNTIIPRNAVLRPSVQSDNTVNPNPQQASQQSTNLEKSNLNPGNFQQKVPSQNIFPSGSLQATRQTNSNLTYTQPNKTSILHQQQNTLSQASSVPNFPQNQYNSLNRPQLQSNIFQSRPNMPNVSQPMSTLHQQTSQMVPNLQQSQYVNSQAFGSMPNVQRSNVSLYSQGSPQTSLQSNNQNMPSTPLQQPFQNTPPVSIQNQSRIHPHNNRYPVQQIAQSQSMTSLQQHSTQQPPSLHTNMQQPNQQFQYPNTQQTQPTFSNQTRPNVTQSGFNKLWGRENYDLLQSPNILPQTKLEPPRVSLGQDFLDAANCSQDIFRCTMTKIPESTALLQKSRLPLGVLIHPFKDLNHLPVIQCNTIVRCRACRTYINPFVFFADSKRWKCNLCYRINDLPDEFQFDPVTKTYGDPSRRPEVKSSTIEYIAPAEYMLRPPQPAVYLFLMDVSRLAIETGYLHIVCNTLSSELVNLPGDARTQIGFVAYDSALHFYSLSEGQSQPHEMTVLDIDDVFLPCPDNLLVNLQDRMEMVSDLLAQLPTRYLDTYETSSALGAALQAGFKMMSATGGRITVFQATLPNIGPGALIPREDPNQRSSSDVTHLNPANDFYKRLALECSGQQVAVDLFVLNSQYVDLATISGISRFSGGCMHHFPLFKASRTLQNETFERSFRRYVTRKIGFEAVMRIRCTRGLSIHTFHGNFFVRSTDLLSLPNINPDAGFGMQVSIEENLTDVQTVCFQAALLYTSSKGERRIRVHTLCLPVANNLSDVINSADQQCIIGLLSKMAVDRSMQSSLSDAREAFLNVAIDILSSYKLSLNMSSGVSGLMAPECLKLMPLYISALLKNIAFRIGISTRLDDRMKAMCDMKTKPLPYLMQLVYPDLYPIHNLEESSVIVSEDDETIHQPPHLQLTARSLDSHGAYLLDMGEHMIIFVCASVTPTFLNNVLDVADFCAISDEIYELPLLENQYSKKLHSFVNYLNDDKPFAATLQVIRENSPNRVLFYERLIEDRLENSLSYHEFLQHIKTQVK